MAGGQWAVLSMVLACFLVQINSNVDITVWYEETSIGYQRTIVFTQDQFEELQQCLSNQTNERCDATYLENTQPYKVDEICPQEGVTKSESYVFRCSNNRTKPSLQCKRQDADLLDQLCNNTYKHHFFRVNNSECFALVWEHEKETFQSHLGTVNHCDGCTETTTTTTLTSTTSTTSTTTTTTTSTVASAGRPPIKSATTPKQPDDEGDNIGMIIGIIAGILAALLLILGAIALYKRKHANPRVAPLESQPNVNRPPADTRMNSRHDSFNYSDTTPIYNRDQQYY